MLKTRRKRRHAYEVGPLALRLVATPGARTSLHPRAGRAPGNFAAHRASRDGGAERCWGSRARAARIPGRVGAGKGWRTKVPGLDDAELRALLMSQPSALGASRSWPPQRSAPLASCWQRCRSGMQTQAASIRGRLHIDPVAGIPRPMTSIIAAYCSGRHRPRLRNAPPMRALTARAACTPWTPSASWPNRGSGTSWRMRRRACARTASPACRMP